MKFETERDRKRQTNALIRLCYEFNLNFIEKETDAYIDAVIRDNADTKDVAYAEVKGVVGKEINKSNNVIIALRKLFRGQELSIQKNLPVCFIWSFDDGIGYIWLKDIEGSVKQGGRAIVREGSTHDRELMVKISVEHLKFLYF